MAHPSRLAEPLRIAKIFHSVNVANRCKTVHRRIYFLPEVTA
ncbi:hypothetical protein CES85_4464 [Ochrobactrum quorumnocens]|uniref:Uncharacterized protein n=1 Tax=Ochrobactrum quorumnocens TaxID=271865 RepID=A0A248UAS0_9HYPH|nr:hypothetical protein CES85_4464 [[Ochrobactrum] quorumnocens]